MHLDKHEASITNVNVRREKHGKEGKLGLDISLSLQTGNATLDLIQKGLKEALYKKADKGQQMDLVEGANGLVALKFPHLEPIKLDIEYTGFEVILHGNLDATEGETPLVDVKLKDFTIKPIEGGSALITFKAQLQADLDELSEVVDWWMVESVRLTLTPPKNQVDQIQPGGKGDTLDQQDEAAAKNAAADLIETGKQAA
jgi:hypothetical protein